MHRRSFIAALGATAIAVPVLASGPRHEVVELRVTMGLSTDGGKLTVSTLQSNTEEVQAQLLAFRDTAQPGDTLTIRFNGETIETITA